MQEIAAVKYEVAKSRFFAHIYLLDFPDEYQEILILHAKLYKKAAHHCSAMNFCMPDGKTASEFKNDGEVGHAGRILLNVLEQNGLNSHAVVVSRIFGGIKLGPAGVGRAFRDSALAAIETIKSEES